MTLCTCIILIVNLPTEKGMDQFMRDKKLNNIIMQSHHSIYTDESP